MSDMPSGWTITAIHGFCPLPLMELAARLETSNLCSLPGDFVVAAERAGERMLLSSAVAATPCYFHHAGGQFTHGGTVFEVARKARLPWRWNSRAVNAMALFEHTLGTDSLHADIRRVEPAARYHWREGALHITRDTQVEESFQAEEDAGLLAETQQAARDACAELCEGRNVAVSLSAGYDSRALLAIALEGGSEPALHTMGRPDSTDVRISAAIARDLGLRHEVLPIEADDYLPHGLEFAAATSGEKSTAHWHTYLFARKASWGDRAIHLAGSNGEMARTYYFDKGILATLADKSGLRLERPLLWMKYSPRRKWPEIPVRSFLASDEAGDGVNEAMDQAVNACSQPRGFLRRLDRFYTMERVRHFIGQGLAVYSRFCPTASPFLDARFVTRAARLGRRWKMNSRFHRRLIGSAFPRLLDYPVDDSGVTMREADRALYWRRKSREVAYDPLPQLLRLASVRDLVMDSVHLDQFMARQFRETLLARQHRQLLCFLINMHFTAENAIAVAKP